jgi:hypothetical protein
MQKGIYIIVLAQAASMIAAHMPSYALPQSVPITTQQSNPDGQNIGIAAKPSLSVIKAPTGLLSANDLASDFHSEHKKFPQAFAISKSNEEPVKRPATQRGCVNIDSIRDAQVQDDENIVLRLRDKSLLLVKLRNRCIGLSFDESFYYQASPTRQLCARFDTITARSGSRCRIEQIVPLTLQELKNMRFSLK